MVARLMEDVIFGVRIFTRTLDTTGGVRELQGCFAGYHNHRLWRIPGTRNWACGSDSLARQLVMRCVGNVSTLVFRVVLILDVIFAVWNFVMRGTRRHAKQALILLTCRSDGMVANCSPVLKRSIIKIEYPTFYFITTTTRVNRLAVIFSVFCARKTEEAHQVENVQSEVQPLSRVYLTLKWKLFCVACRLHFAWEVVVT